MKFLQNPPAIIPSQQVCEGSPSDFLSSSSGACENYSENPRVRSMFPCFLGFLLRKTVWFADSSWQRVFFSSCLPCIFNPQNEDMERSKIILEALPSMIPCVVIMKLKFQHLVRIREYRLGVALPVRVTTRIITFSVGVPYEPSFTIVTGRGNTQSIGFIFTTR